MANPDTGPDTGPEVKLEKPLQFKSLDTLGKGSVNVPASSFRRQGFPLLRLGGVSHVLTNGIQLGRVPLNTLDTQVEVSYLLVQERLNLEDRLQRLQPVLSWFNGYSYYNNYSSGNPDGVETGDGDLDKEDTFSLAEAYQIDTIRLINKEDRFEYLREEYHQGGITAIARTDTIFTDLDIAERHGLWEVSGLADTLNREDFRENIEMGWGSLLPWYEVWHGYWRSYSKDTRGGYIDHKFGEEQFRLERERQNIDQTYYYANDSFALSSEYGYRRGIWFIYREDTLKLTEPLFYISGKYDFDGWKFGDIGWKSGITAFYQSGQYAFNDVGTTSHPTRADHFKIEERAWIRGLVNKWGREDFKVNDNYVGGKKQSSDEATLTESWEQHGRRVYWEKDDSKMQDWGGTQFPKAFEHFYLKDRYINKNPSVLDEFEVAEAQFSYREMLRKVAFVLEDGYLKHNTRVTAVDGFSLDETGLQSGIRAWHSDDIAAFTEGHLRTKVRYLKPLSDAFTLESKCFQRGKRVWSREEYFSFQDKRVILRYRTTGSSDDSGLNESFETERWITKRENFSVMDKGREGAVTLDKTGSESFLFEDPFRVIWTSRKVTDQGFFLDGGYSSGKLGYEKLRFYERYHLKNNTPNVKDDFVLNEEEGEQHGRRLRWAEDQFYLDEEGWPNGKRSFRFKDYGYFNEREIRPTIHQRVSDSFVLRDECLSGNKADIDYFYLEENSLKQKVSPYDTFSLEERYRVLGWVAHAYDWSRLIDNSGSKLERKSNDHAQLSEKHLLEREIKASDASSLSVSYKQLDKNDFLLVDPAWVTERPGRIRTELRLNETGLGELAAWKDSSGILRRALKTTATWKKHRVLDPVKLPANARHISASIDYYAYELEGKIYFKGFDGSVDNPVTQSWPGKTPVMCGDDVFYLTASRRKLYRYNAAERTHTFIADFDRSGYIRQVVGKTALVLDLMERPLHGSVQAARPGPQDGASVFSIEALTQRDIERAIIPVEGVILKPGLFE